MPAQSGACARAAAVTEGQSVCRSAGKVHLFPHVLLTTFQGVPGVDLFKVQEKQKLLAALSGASSPSPR